MEKKEDFRLQLPDNFRGLTESSALCFGPIEPRQQSNPHRTCIHTLRNIRTMDAFTHA